MNRFLLTVLVIFLVQYGTAQEDEYVSEWSSKKLTWEDFKGEPNLSSEFIAVSAGKIDVSSKEPITVLTKKIYLTIRSLFYNEESWTITNSGEILQHEQLHSDIREVYARMMIKKLLEKTEFISSENAQKWFDIVYSELDKKMRLTQGEYDNETNHSMNKERQKEWNEKVAKQLEELKDYTDTEIIITIKK